MVFMKAQLEQMAKMRNETIDREKKVQKTIEKKLTDEIKPGKKKEKVRKNMKKRV